MARTVWYPGHMAKGRRQLEALAGNIDLILEVRDARAPSLTSSPHLGVFASKIKVGVVLSKADLADEKVTKLWVEKLRPDFPVWALDLRHGGMAQIKKALTRLKPDYRDLRMAVAGIPNVGKSMLINQLVGRKAAVVGGIPGVTRGVSWFRGQGFLLVDSPGILDPHSDARAHKLLSWIGSSRADVLDNWENISRDCIAFLVKRGFWPQIEKTWGIPADDDASKILEGIGRRLGKLRQGGEIDMEGAGCAFMDAFACGRFGRMSFEKPGDAPLWESQ